MSLEYNDVIKQGYVKLKGRSVGLWQKRWIVLRKPSSKGPRRIEKYQDERDAMNGTSTLKDIDLSNHVKGISRLPEDIKKYAVAIRFDDGQSRQFACDSELEADEWAKALTRECLNSQSVQNNVDLLASLPTQGDIIECYNVNLLPSPNLEIRGECLMQITSENIHLLDVSNHSRRMVTWPLNALRRYGRDESKFTFEAGRFCDTGEGMFVFTTVHGERIYQRVHQATLAIAETHRFNNRQNLRSRSVGQLPSMATIPSITPDRSGLATVRSLPPTPLRSSSPPKSPLVHSASFHGRISPPHSPLAETPGTSGSVPSLPPRPANLMKGRPLPEIPSNGEQENEDPEYIYEEKGLDPKFREFLHKRKDDMG